MGGAAPGMGQMGMGQMGMGQMGMGQMGMGQGPGMGQVGTGQEPGMGQAGSWGTGHQQEAPDTVVVPHIGAVSAMQWGSAPGG
eukprot:2396522-Rhodomonas_salina.1